ncbi:MAG: glycosyltransferase family 2 protein, partial [Bacteroidales bacterium]|nr:glycosyltransferase family 2 protein [Bacteroidales bacterium]
MREKFKLSLVIPCYNEENNISFLYKNLIHFIKEYSYEIIFIDDGSTDGTLSKIKSLSKEHQNIKYLSLSRNFGHQNALKAGYDYSSGDCVISLDADSQHPAYLIKDMISKWQDNYDVVYTIRNDNNTKFFKKYSSKLFYKLINKLSDTKIRQGAADFRLLDKKLINEIRKLDENYLFIRGLISWLGFKQVAIYYNPEQRHSGETKYSTKKMLKLASSGITAFSTKPLKVSIYLGFFIAIFAFLYALYAIYIASFTSKALPGWTSTIVSVLFIGGIQLFMIGILGEYLGKLFIENKKRPNYIINENNL